MVTADPHHAIFITMFSFIEMVSLLPW